MTIKFSIAGIPKSTQTGSVMKFGNRMIPVRRNTPWSSICGLVAREYAPPTPLTGALAVVVVFRLSKPKSSRRVHPTVRPDIENYVKGLLDSWSGVLWNDDAQVVRLTLTKQYADEPGVDVEVDELPETPKGADP